MLPSVIQCATSRRLPVIAERYSHEWICDAYCRNVEQCVTFPPSLVMVINVFGHSTTNVSTVEFVKWSVNQVKYIKCTVFTVDKSEKLSEGVQ